MNVKGDKENDGELGIQGADCDSWEVDKFGLPTAVRRGND